MARIDIDRAGEYVGAHVRMDWHGRTLLGEIVGVQRAADWRGPTLAVRYFNRDPWPMRPLASDVEVLERDYEEISDGGGGASALRSPGGRNGLGVSL